MNFSKFNTFASYLGPAFAVEISHPAYRGVMTGCYNCFYTLADVLAAGCTRASVVFPNNQAWLIPVWVQMAFPALVCLFVWFLPESPRWLFSNGQREKAIEFLKTYHGEGNLDSVFVRFQLTEFESNLELNGSDKRWWDYRALYNTRAARYRMGVNLVFICFGELSSGGISYFIGGFYASAGITDPTTVLNFSLGRTFLSLFMAFFGAFLSDLAGRRKLILSSIAGMCLMWTGITVCTGIFKNTGNAESAKAGIAFYFLFCFFYAYGITPNQGLYAIEVLSYEQRAKGMSISLLVKNACDLLNFFTTPIALSSSLGYKAYIIWTVWNGFEFIVGYFFFPETKNYTLEELDEIFEAKSPRKASTQRHKAVIDSQGGVLSGKEIV